MRSYSRKEEYLETAAEAHQKLNPYMPHYAQSGVEIDDNRRTIAQWHREELNQLKINRDTKRRKPN